MIKNLQENLHQGYLNNQREQKCEKCSKTFYKIFYKVLSKIFNRKKILKSLKVTTQRLQGYDFFKSL